MEPQLLMLAPYMAQATLYAVGSFIVACLPIMAALLVFGRKK
jgi:hypothetical protein